MLALPSAEVEQDFFMNDDAALAELAKDITGSLRDYLRLKRQIDSLDRTLALIHIEASRHEDDLDWIHVRRLAHAALYRHSSSDVTSS